MKQNPAMLKAFSLKIQSKNSEFLKSTLKTSNETFHYIRQFYFDDIEIFESFFLLLLNRSNTTIGYVKISQGGTAGTVVDLKIIAKYAVDSLASSVIIAHNHPSVNTTPSQQDIGLTKKCKQGLENLDIKLLDHLIMTDNNYLSFTDEGLL